MAVRLEIGEDDDGRRLDALLRRRLGVPRSLAMKLIRKGDVRVNGGRAEPSRSLAIGDVVEARGVREPAGARARAPAAPPPKPLPAWFRGAILLEDPDILVFDKPPGLVAHAGSGHEWGAVEMLVDGYLRPRSGAPRPALVHRLDRDTSGLLVLAKTPLALRRLNASLRRGEVEKGYSALVRGVPDPPEGEVRAALAKRRGADGRERMEVVPDGEGLAAVTGYRVRRAVGGGLAALVDLALETGRTHQLRAHLAHAGHPIALDRKYGDPRFDREVEERAGLRRLFLHAARLRFPHPRTGAPVAIESPLARDLADALARLG